MLDAAGVALTNEFDNDGYVLRIAIDLSAVSDPAFRVDSDAIVVAASAPPNSITLFEPILGLPRIGVFSRNNDEFDAGFGIYGIIPEPSSAFLIVAGLGLIRVRSAASRR